MPRERAHRKFRCNELQFGEEICTGNDMQGDSTISEQDAAHERWMRLALEQADLAAAAGEVPVGAVLVKDGELLASGFNCPITSCDATAHAEIVVLRSAAGKVANYRLPGTTLYVTIEPCTMCVGALMHARVGQLVFGAREPRAGAVSSQQQLTEQEFFNHRLSFVEGILAAECGERLQSFFRERRNRNGS